LLLKTKIELWKEAVIGLFKAWLEVKSLIFFLMVLFSVFKTKKKVF